jgi:hypothetical protein
MQKLVFTSSVMFAVALAGCGQKIPGLGGLAAKAPVPEIKVSQVMIESKPSNKMLGGYYCNEAAGGGMLAMGCRVFGSIAAKADLKFTFKVELEAKNPSPAPMPVVAAMIAFTAYPADSAGQNLGSVCVQMCEDPNNCPQAADACNSSEPTIKGASDFASAAAGFLVSTALNGGPKDDLRIPMVPAGGTLKFVAGLSLNIDQMLALIKRASGDAMSQAKSGKTPTFTIPWAVEGSVWVNFQGFGRIGASFPQQTGEWQLQ